MDAPMMRQAVALFALAAILAGCTSMSTKQRTILGETHTSPVSWTMPGVSDLDTVTKEDKEDSKWWNGFYGNKTAEDGFYGSKSAE